MPLEIIILAAGQGTRMKSATPKVLHKLGGQSLLARVLATARELNPIAIHVVVGHCADQIKAATLDPNINWVLQAEQKGTGHAVQQVLPYLQASAQVLILYADVPLVQKNTLLQLVVANAPLSLLTAELSNPTGYGRILRNAQAQVLAIIEHKDADEEQHKITEINTGIMRASTERLKHWLANIDSNNAQGEFYLTDIVAMAAAEDAPIHTSYATAKWEVQGVNDRAQLAALERKYQRQQALSLMKSGVSLMDPRRLDIRGKVEVGRDTIIDINVVFEGACKLGTGVSIGPNCVIKDSNIADHVRIEAYSHIEGADIASGATVGPFARIRPGTVMKSGSRVGNFVEVKAAEIGEGSKVNHLSYIGDAILGQHVNIGAGTITCNYDGANKNQTNIGNNVFVGSNTSIVAPLTIADNATVAAGSTITSFVDNNQLAIGRSRQRNIDHWQRPDKGKP